MSQSTSPYESLSREFQIQFLETGLALNPEDLKIVEALGFAYTAAGRYAEGLVMDQRLACAFPNHPLVLYNLACSLSRCERLDECLLALMQSVDNGYDDLQHLLEDEDLENLRAASQFETFLEHIGATADDDDDEEDDETWKPGID